MSNLLNKLKTSPDATIELTDKASSEIINKIDPIVGYVKGKWTEAKDARKPHDVRWIKAYKNFRGIADTSTSFIKNEVSKAFIKVSKTKALAAVGQISEVLYSQDRIPIEIVSSKVPLGMPEYAHVDPESPIEAPQSNQGMAPDVPVLGFPGDGNDLKPGETMLDRVKTWFQGKFGEQVKVKEGPGDKPDRIVYKPAEEAAFLMNKRIHDQFEDMDVITSCRQGTWEACVLGSGVLKGPFTKDMEYPNWDESGVYTPIVESVPVVKQVPIWNIYPDPDGTSLSNTEYLIERHRLGKSALRQLKKLKSFRHNAIDELLLESPNYIKEDHENVLNENQNTYDQDRYEVLEFWGKIDAKTIEESGIDLGFDLPDGIEEVDVNVWVSGQHILRFVLNPLTPSRLPYYITPYEFNPYSPFGIGICENMEDTQSLMNGFMRLAVDNAVLSGSIMLEIDESLMVPGQDYIVETGKVFRKNGGLPNQRAVQSISIGNTSQANMQMFDVARRLADEATGIPSFSHGMTGVQGVGRTSSGISMLLGAASNSTKIAVKNFDDYWFKPLGQWMYYWNMQHKFDPKLKGDLSAVAKGTANIVQKEEMVEKYIKFAQVAFPNPALAPWINPKEWLKKLGVLMGLDTDLILNRPDEAKLQAMIMYLAGGLQGAPGQVSATSGIPPGPGDQGFTGTPQQQGVDNGQPQQAPTQPTGPVAGPGGA